MVTRLFNRPGLLLALGAVLVVFTFLRFGMGEFGWVVFAPLLIYLHKEGSARRHMAVLGTLVAAYLLTMSKMVTSEISWIPVPVFGIPFALSAFVLVAFGSLIHRKLGARWGVYAFAAMAVVLGWIQYTFTGGASWVVLASTQLEYLTLVQLTSLTGLGGLTFLVAMGSALVAAALCEGSRRVRSELWVFGFLLMAALLFGQWRLSQPSPGNLVRVGSVVSPITHKEFAGARVNVDTLRSFDYELFVRSAKAVSMGAEVVVWNEIATLVSAEGEEALAAHGSSFARAHGVALLMAYGVVESETPLKLANKYRVYMPDGSLADEYLKRHPVPGDPDRAGQAHAKCVAFRNARITGGICYDYSYPAIARDNASDGGDLALVPASDWRGIDPEHGRMAQANAVAAGLSMVRPVRAATSIACDPYGRILGSMHALDPGAQVMVTAVPARRVPTLYAQAGEVLPILALAFVLLCLFKAWRAGQAP